MNNFAKFLSINGLKRKDIAAYLGVSGAFITQIASGGRPLPDEKLALIKANAYNWDISMLTKPNGLNDSMLIGLRDSKHEVSHSKLQSAIEKTLNPEEQFLIGYLERKIEDKDKLIRELEKKIGMLEAKLELARKGDVANDAVASLSADAV